MNVVRIFVSGILCFLLFTALVLLGIITTINMTILNPDFVVSELNKLDVYSIIAKEAKARLPGQQFIDAETVEKALAELKPWFDQQSSTVIHVVYGYLKEDRELNVAISLEQVRYVVKKYAREAVLKSLPPQLQGASQSLIDAYMPQVYNAIDKLIPGSFALDEAVLGHEMTGQLRQIRQTIHNIDTAYNWLIGLAVLLVLLIALVYWWQPKPITLSIGITFILAGIACILGSLLDFWISQALSDLAVGSNSLSGLQAKLPQLASDLTVPIRIYGIGFLVAGIVVVVISVLFRLPKISPD